MAYTPINWQTGDTITADKLNRCDNGWGYEATELFSETVTTSGSGTYGATLDYSGTINADSITVTFDGTEYTCPRIDAFNAYFYGGFTEQGPVFTEYPFALQSINGANTIFTETASTHAVSVTAGTMETSSDFRSAVLSVGALPMLCVSGVTTYDEMDAANSANRLMYFYNGDGRCAIVANMNSTPIGITPAYSDLTVEFDSDNIFTVSAN